MKTLNAMYNYAIIFNTLYIAHDQLFFPLNMEIQKAETRVMTYLARPGN